MSRCVLVSPFDYCQGVEEGRTYIKRQFKVLKSKISQGPTKSQVKKLVVLIQKGITIHNSLLSRKKGEENKSTENRKQKYKKTDQVEDE
jgi:hypothetical protein